VVRAGSIRADGLVRQKSFCGGCPVAGGALPAPSRGRRAAPLQIFII
jgi:hypothetical protein